MSRARRALRREAPVTFVEDARGLRELCDVLGRSDRFAIDTEFVGERTYVPRLEVIQVATASHCAVVDCQSATQLEPFFDLLLDRKIEKVFHAGQQDMEMFAGLCASVPGPIFDTQVAAAMLGYGEQPGYATLVERLLGVQVAKTETLSDWSRRPLTCAQLAYAVDDVRYLLPLHEALRKRLLAKGREAWASEEFRRIEASVRNEPRDPMRAYLRVRGRGSLRARGLSVLRELAAWRERLAMQENKPRATIIRDEALVEVARKAPTTVASLRGLRAIRARALEARADEIVECVRRALALPEDQWPQPSVLPLRIASHGVVELLSAVLRARAEEVSVASSLLATHADLQNLVQQHGKGDLGGLPILEGWRREIVGKDLLDLLEGQVAVRVEPKRGRIRLNHHPVAG
jgi:ribonuclease D